MKFRKLRADEIDVRVGGVYKAGIALLLYKDARCDMAILDETVGPGCWQRDHKAINNTIYCGVGIYIPNPAIEAYPDTWVWKWDAGSESNTEAEKGAASDSFKRACVNWGIGRELYTAPLIFIRCATEQNPNGKGYRLADKRDGYGYTVKAIEYDYNTISYLEIEKDGATVFSYGLPIGANMGGITAADRKRLEALSRKHGMPEDYPLTIAGVDHWEDMTPAGYNKVVRHYEGNV